MAYRAPVAGLCVRELREDDLRNGFPETLDALRPTSGIDPAAAAAVFERLRRNPDTIVAVAEQDGRIVGAGTLHLLRKFLYGGSVAGHVEDVAVAAGRQGSGVGSAVVRYLLSRARQAGCYKTVLYCEDGLMPFYGKLGFRRTTNGMRFDHGAPPSGGAAPGRGNRPGNGAA